MAHDQVTRAARLAAQLGDARGDVDEQVRIGAQPALHPVQILGGAGHMRGDEGRRRVGGYETLERFEQALVVPAAEMRLRPAGVGQQLFETLVARVERLEEGPRVGGVDEHRHTLLGGHVPHRRQPLVVGQQEPAALVGEAEPEILPDLESPGAGSQRAPQAVRQALTEPRRRRLAPIEVAEGDEAPGVTAVVAFQVGLELGAPASVEIDDRPQVERVHVGQQAGDVGHHPVAIVAEPAAEMVVRVDGGASRARRVMLGEPQRRAGQIVAELQLREVAVRVGPGHGRTIYLSAQMALRSAHI